MDYLAWLFQSVTLTGATLAILWLSRNLILTRLSRSVQHEFDTKLESLRSSLREREESLRADLRERENEIAALRSSAIAALSDRQAAVHKRRLEAVDQVWSASVALAKARSAFALLFIDPASTRKALETNPDFGEILNAIGAEVNLETLSNAASARPYISSIAWATYSAMQAITVTAVLQSKLLLRGIPPPKSASVSNEDINKIIETALPGRTRLAQEDGTPERLAVLSDLEDRLLRELQASLAGEEHDKGTIERAAEILRLSNEAMGKVERASRTEPKSWLRDTSART